MGRSNSPEIPKAAKAWTLWQVTTTTRRNKETGRNYPANITRRLTGDADEEGAVADTWPVSEFSVKAVRERWGAGRFRVDWYDNKGAKLGDWKFNIAEPAPRAAAAASSPAGEDDDDESALMSRLPSTQMGWLMWTQAREERAERRRAAEAREERERMRQEADDRAQRDRDFLREVAGARAATAAAAPAAAPGVDITRELGLFKREMALMLREQNLQLRAELAANQPEEDGPETPADALNSAGVELIEGVGEALGELGPDVLGAVRKWLRAKGVEDSPENLEALVERAALEVAEMKKTNGAAAHE